jgi:DNA repair exonuclease SbcCD ATPase subunit
MRSIDEVRTKIDEYRGEKNYILNKIEGIKKDLIRVKKERRDIEDAQRIIQFVAKQTQEELKYHISELVSLALSAIYDDPYEFELEFITKRDRTEANPIFKRNGKKFIPGKRTGYSSVDIAAFALRISIWNIKRPRTRNTMIFDEPFTSLDKKAKSKIGSLLRMISKKLNLQIIMSTHDHTYLMKSADKIFKTSKESQISNVVEVSYYENDRET